MHTSRMKEHTRTAESTHMANKHLKIGDETKLNVIYVHNKTDKAKKTIIATVMGVYTSHTHMQYKGRNFSVTNHELRSGQSVLI